MLLGAILITIIVSDILARLIIGNNKTLRKIYMYSGLIVGSLFLAIALFLGALPSFPKLQRQVFASFFMPHEAFDEVRCKDISSGVSGRVLEIGPGPGSNFRCWTDNTGITEWVGVEPNEFFEIEQARQKSAYNISFPTKTVWMGAENNLDIEPATFDFVVSTHVLCSVGDVTPVLAQIERALKPGGKYFFVEHVAAEKDTYNEYFQRLVAPLFFRVGAGCEFKDMRSELTQPQIVRAFDMQIEDFEADSMPLPILVPHVRGVATKKEETSILQ